MVGNDLVDLKLAAIESNWKRTGYLEKIFSTEEQRLIREANDPSILVWLFWTMKESAYKVLNRMTGIRSYAPLSLECREVQIDEFSASGQVWHPYGTFFSSSVLSKELIHSIAALTAQELFGISVTYHKNVLNYLEDYNQSSVSYSLAKNSMGLPEIINRENGITYPASISHHGRYLAIAHSGSLRSAG